MLLCKHAFASSSFYDDCKPANENYGHKRGLFLPLPYAHLVRLFFFLCLRYIVLFQDTVPSILLESADAKLVARASSQARYAHAMSLIKHRVTEKWR